MRKEYKNPLLRMRAYVDEAIADVNVSGGKDEIIGDENDGWEEW